MQGFIPQPPPEIYEIASSEEELILKEAGTNHLKVREDYSNGINIFVEGALYPKKGFVTPKAMWALNVVKKICAEALQLLFTPQMFLVIPCILVLPKVKFLQKVLDSFNRLSLGVMAIYILKPEYQMNVTKEIKALIERFLLNFGITQIASSDTAKLISHFIEYDTAYRFPLLDLFSVSSKENWINNPRKEAKRLTDIFLSRQINYFGVGRKIKRLSFIFRVLLLSPKFKKAFIEAMKQATFENFQFDETDTYWAMIRSDYHYFGKKFEERMKTFTDMGMKLPTLYTHK